MATPGLRALRAWAPAAHITAQLRPGFEDLLAGHPAVDDVLPVASWHRGARALWNEGRALRERSFDLGICLPDSWSSALLMRAARVRRIAGYRRTGRGLLLHDAVQPLSAWGPRRLVSREHYVLHLLEAIGCPARGSELELHTTDAEEARADQLLEPLGSGPIVALAPGASYGAAKRWSPESFAKVADRLAAAGAQVVLIGSEHEAALARAVGTSARRRPLDLSGETDLGTLKVVLRRASALVCNDAGARHIATAFRTPAVTLFGPTALEKTDGNLETVQVVRADVECSPCHRRDCPIDHRCMTRIEPDDVFVRTRAVL